MWAENEVLGAATAERLIARADEEVEPGRVKDKKWAAVKAACELASAAAPLSTEDVNERVLRRVLPAIEDGVEGVVAALEGNAPLVVKAERDALFTLSGASAVDAALRVLLVCAAECEVGKHDVDYKGAKGDTRGAKLRARLVSALEAIN